MASVNLGRVGLVLQGDWNSTTQYVPLDVVSYDGNSWVARQTNTNITPNTTNNAFWQLISNNADLVSTVQGYKNDAASSATAAAASAAVAASSAVEGSDALANEAATFSDSTAYTAGQYVIYDNGTHKFLYRFTADHAAGPWTGTDAVQVTLGADVADLKSAFRAGKLYENVAKVADSAEYEAGTISATAGTKVDSTTRIRTAEKYNADGAYAYTTDGYSFAVFVYDADNVYQGWFNGTEITTSSHVIWLTECAFYYPGYQFRYVIRKDDDSTIAVTDADNLVMMDATDKTLSLPGKAADAKETGDALRTANGNINLIMSGLGVGTISFTENQSILTAGKAINASGAEISDTRSYASAFIQAYPGCAVSSVYDYGETAPTSSWYHYIFFYDANQNYITDSRIGGSKKTTVEGFVPANARYIRVSLTYIRLENLTGWTFAQTVDFGSGSPQNKWHVFGDSISAGYYSMTASMAQEAGLTLDYTSPVTTDQGETTGSVWDSSLSHNYWGYANKWALKRILIGNAYPGQGYIRKSANNKNGIMMVQEVDVSDAGLITVAWGFNDWHYNQPRGNHDLIDQSVPYPTADFDTAQITTINQAIWYCLGTLIRKAPNAKIVVQTPMNGWAYGGDFASNWGIGTAKSSSGTLADIHDDIKYWADYYGLQVLDMTYNNSIVNRQNIKTTIIDGSHPSDAAHQQLGRHVAVALIYS